MHGMRVWADSWDCGACWNCSQPTGEPRTAKWKQGGSHHARDDWGTLHSLEPSIHRRTGEVPCRMDGEGPRGVAGKAGKRESLVRERTRESVSTNQQTGGDTAGHFLIHLNQEGPTRGISGAVRCLAQLGGPQEEMNGGERRKNTHDGST